MANYYEGMRRAGLSHGTESTNTGLHLAGADSTRQQLPRPPDEQIAGAPTGRLPSAYGRPPMGGCRQPFYTNHVGYLIANPLEKGRSGTIGWFDVP